MDLNVQDWKEFEINRLFSIKRGDRIVKDEDYFDISPSDDYKYRVITASATNNGVDGVYNDFNCDGNCLISCGEANGMFTTWQNEPCWVLDTARIYTPKGFSLNEITGMFLATLLSANMYRFSYGRKAKPDNMYSLGLKLPIQHNPDGTPIIDVNKTYSDEGYIPNWQFMEDYIKSLHSEPITTTRGAAESLSLGVDKWKEFNLSDVFIAETGNTDITQELLTDDGEIVVSAGEGNTGVIGRCSVEARIFPKNTITLDMFGFAFPRPYEYKMVTHARIFSLSVKKHIMSCKQSIFMATMLNNSGYKYAYGRMCSWERVKNDTISLPIQRDASGNPVIDPDKKYSDKGYIPDWDFMERYIDSLPYSDKIA